MPENKKETNVDSIKMLGEYKATKLAELSENISRQKSRAAVIMASIKAKRDELVQKAEQIEKAKEEAKAVEKAKFEEVENKIERESEKSVEKVKTQETPVVESKVEVKTEKETKVEKQVKKDDTSASEKETVKAEEKTEKKSKQDEAKKSRIAVVPKTPFELAQENPEILPNGEVRRIYVPPTPKPKVTTRVFGQGGYQQPRGPKPQQNGQGPRPQGQNQGQNGGLRRSSSQSVANAAQQFPPKPAAQKGKGGKQNSNNGSSKFDDKSTMNKRALMKRGYLVDDRISYDEDGEAIVRNYKVNKNRGGGNSATVIIENAVITTDPVSIKTLSEKIGKSAAEIVKTLFVLGIMKTINDSIDFATAELVADEFGIKLEYKPDVTLEDTLSAQLEVDDVEELENLVPRPP
ncbi:MAG TPA: hypothetical protein DE061_02870, partial [Clostridiales bacterium]|nr:hypothetical protein [Clostridiales bacterium]